MVPVNSMRFFISIGPFFIYFLGLGSLLISDVFVTKFFVDQNIETWAEVRSLIGISGVICLVGLDQMLFRSRKSSGRILRLLSVQIPLLAVPVGLLIWWTGYLGSWLIASLLAIGSAGSLALFQYFRSHNRPIQSQFSGQGWKILVFLAVSFITVTKTDVALDAMVVVMMLLSLLVAGFLVLRRSPSCYYPQDPECFGALYSTGTRFMVTSLFLALAVYAQQLVVNGLGSAQEGARYFTHATYFLFPISVANGYFAFLIGPWIRDNHDRFVSIMHGWAWLIILGVICFAVLVHGIGWVGWMLVSPAVGAPDHVLQMIFIVMCVTMTLYTFPSAYNGVFARPPQFDLLILGQITALALAVGTFIVLYIFGYARLTHAVAVASAMNWVLRTAIGFGVIHVIVKSRR